jgi:hypothetical protein
VAYDFSKMSKADLVAAIKQTDQLVIATQKYVTDLETGRAIPKDPLTKEKSIESSGLMIKAKLEENTAMMEELARRGWSS